MTDRVSGGTVPVAWVRGHTTLARIDAEVYSTARIEYRDLVCDAELERFYQRLGMMKRSGMIRRNYARQSAQPETG